MSDDHIQPPPGITDRPVPQPERPTCPECGSDTPGDPDAPAEGACWLCHAAQATPGPRTLGWGRIALYALAAVVLALCIPPLLELPGLLFPLAVLVMLALAAFRNRPAGRPALSGFNSVLVWFPVVLAVVGLSGYVFFLALCGLILINAPGR